MYLTTDKGKPPPPPKPAALVAHRDGVGIQLSSEMFNQLRQLRKKTKDLRIEVRNLRRMAQQQSQTAKEALREASVKIKMTLSFLSGSSDAGLRIERMKVSSDLESYGGDAAQLEQDLSELESKVEELRSNVINRRCRVNMCDVQSVALILVRASKTVADLKARYPNISETLKSVMTQEMDYVVREEKLAFSFEILMS